MTTNTKPSVLIVEDQNILVTAYEVILDGHGVDAEIVQDLDSANKKLLAILEVNPQKLVMVIDGDIPQKLDTDDNNLKVPSQEHSISFIKSWRELIDFTSMEVVVLLASSDDRYNRRAEKIIHENYPQIKTHPIQKRLDRFIPVLKTGKMNET